MIFCAFILTVLISGAFITRTFGLLVLGWRFFGVFWIGRIVSRFEMLWKVILVKVLIH